MNDFDRLLSRSAPPSAPDGPALDASIGALVDEARAIAAPRRPRRKWAVAGVLAGAVALTGAAAYGVNARSNDGPWNLVDQDATQVEWQVELPDGTRCVMRANSFDLSDEQQAVVTSALSDPRQLLAIDGGAVRQQLLAAYDERDAEQANIDRDAWESWIDAGYEAVASMDVGAGRGSLRDEQLGTSPQSVESDTFFHAHLKVIVEGVTARGIAQGVDVRHAINPESACEVGE